MKKIKDIVISPEEQEFIREYISIPFSTSASTIAGAQEQYDKYLKWKESKRSETK